MKKDNQIDEEKLKEANGGAGLIAKFPWDFEVGDSVFCVKTDSEYFNCQGIITKVYSKKEAWEIPQIDVQLHNGVSLINVDGNDFVAIKLN